MMNRRLSLNRENVGFDTPRISGGKRNYESSYNNP